MKCVIWCCKDRKHGWKTTANRLHSKTNGVSKCQAQPVFQPTKVSNIAAIYLLMEMFHVPEVLPATVGAMTTLSPWADIDTGGAPAAVEEESGLLAVNEWMVT